MQLSPKAKPPRPSRRPAMGSTRPRTQPLSSGPSIVATVSTRVSPPEAAVKSTAPSATRELPTRIGWIRPVPRIGAPGRGWSRLSPIAGKPPPETARSPSMRVRPLGQ
jgi:hypothetical protein